MTPRRLHGLAFGCYTLLSLLLTWPLVWRLTTHVPGIAQWAFDESTFLWNIWYFKDAVIDRLSSPLHSGLIWFPLGIDLILYTYNFYHALVAQPLALAVNLPFASNLTLLSSTVLSGYGTFLLLWYLLASVGWSGVEGWDSRTGGQWDRGEPNTTFRWGKGQVPPARVWLAALVAGMVYAFASNRSIYAALGHYDMVTTQWIPFYALMLVRSLDASLSMPRRRKAAALAGLFFAFTGLAEMISALFLAIFTLIALCVLLPPLLRPKAKQLAHEAAQQTSSISGTQGVPASGPRSPISNLRSPISNLQSVLSLLLITGLVAVLIWSPVLVPILRQFLTNDFSLKGWGEAIPLSTDLLGWFTPTVLHPLWGSDLVSELRRVQFRGLAEDAVGFRDLNTVFLGWVTLGLALLGALRYGRRVALWIWTTLVFGLFTLGPFLQINGRYRFNLDGIEATIPLPYALLHYLPIIKANRAPNRNSVVLMLGLAVLAGYGIYWVLQRLEIGDRRSETSRSRSPISNLRSPISNLRSPIWVLQSLLALTLALAVIFEHLAVPAPLSDARIPPVYAQIAADPRQVSILQAPLGWRNSFGVFGPEETLLQYYQSAHGKAMLGGNISRAPDFKLDYFQRIPYFQALTEIEFGRPVAPELLAAAQGQGAELAYLYHLGYVLLFPPIPGRYPYVDTWQATWNFLKTSLPLEPSPFWSGDGIEAYRVVEPPGDDQFALDLGVAGTFPYLGEGWSDAEVDTPYDASATWATALQSLLFIPLRGVDEGATYTIRSRLHPFAYPGSPVQQVALTINDQKLGTQSLNGDWQEISWSVPGTALRDGLNQLTLDWGYAVAPRTVIPGSRLIGQTGVELPVDADLKGFAEGGFIALFDEAGQQSDASAGRHGVNVTVLDPQTGAIRQQAGFDTTANQFESEKLAAFLGEIPADAPVLVVSYGDATAHLTAEAINALRQIGADVTLEGLLGQSFAIVGVQGAAPGTAAFASDPKEAFLRISRNRDRRTLAAAVDSVRVERANSGQ